MQEAMLCNIDFGKEQDELDTAGEIQQSIFKLLKWWQEEPKPQKAFPCEEEEFTGSIYSALVAFHCTWKLRSKHMEIASLTSKEVSLLGTSKGQFTVNAYKVCASH